MTSNFFFVFFLQIFDPGRNSAKAPKDILGEAMSGLEKRLSRLEDRLENLEKRLEKDKTDLNSRLEKDKTDLNSRLDLIQTLLTNLAGAK
jgi:chromosome segregation ATPase